MKFNFPGSKIVNGDIEKIEIDADNEEEAIEIYNALYPQYDFNKNVERRNMSKKPLIVKHQNLVDPEMERIRRKNTESFYEITRHPMSGFRHEGILGKK